VVEELAHGDVAALHRELGNVFRDVVVERQLAPLDELHHGDAGERQHRAYYMVDRLVFRRDVEAEVGEAVALVQEDTPVFRDEHRRADDVLLGHDARHGRVEARRRLRAE